MLWWITSKAGGFGPVLSAPSKFQDAGVVLQVFSFRRLPRWWVLGHGGSEHSGFHALCAKPARPGAWARRWVYPRR